MMIKQFGILISIMLLNVVLVLLLLSCANMHIIGVIPFGLLMGYGAAMLANKIERAHYKRELGKALLQGMQHSSAQAGMATAFNASPEELGEAALKEAKRNK